MLLAVISIRLDSFRDFIDQYGPRVSEEGIFLVTDSSPAPGEKVEFEVGLEDDFRLLHGSGEVVWTVAPGQDPGQPAGAAVRFLETDESSRRLITRIVHQQRERGEPVFDLAAAPGAEAAASAVAEDPFGSLPEPDADLFDGLRFDLVEQGGFSPPPAGGPGSTGAREAEVRPALLEPDLPDAAPEIELPGAELEPPPAPAPVDREPAAGPEDLPEPVEGGVTEELPEWMRPIREPSGPEELLEMPDLPAIGEAAPAVPPPSEDEPAAEAPPVPSLEEQLRSAERKAAPAPVRPVEMPRPAARVEAETPRRRSRWGWIAAGVGAVAVAALGVGAYLEGETLKVWLGLAPADGVTAVAPAGAPEAASAPEEGAAPPAAPIAPAPEPEAAVEDSRTSAVPLAAFRRVEGVTWREEAGRTVLVVVTDGAVSSDRVEIEPLDGGIPRLLIKLRGVEQALDPPTIPVGTGQVRQVRSGFHDRPGGPELHLVADLTGANVRQDGLDLRGSEIRISLSGG